MHPSTEVTIYHRFSGLKKPRNLFCHRPGRQTSEIKGVGRTGSFQRPPERIYLRSLFELLVAAGHPCVPRFVAPFLQSRHHHLMDGPSVGLCVSSPFVPLVIGFRKNPNPGWCHLKIWTLIPSAKQWFQIRSYSVVRMDISSGRPLFKILKWILSYIIYYFHWFGRKNNSAERTTDQQ